ncbi:50S ribosomal protein L19e [Thermofilum pendens]|uniref:Large ribosomal subunit protein eL19 n=1 Tax=Thermofilum pendens (strain DSM 2475 / Hrk 5) TaxID=368408 RepID=A1RWR8_THEPD|nr:50S ribosomal protein L19e [Thermofilum pendens]ABL77648.1 LSU ribosomal protein L19E [Thermofilum pendens Hrk 5]
MDVSLARRLASEVLGVGESRIWIDPDKLDEVSAAISRSDVRRLIKDGVIRVLPPSTPSRGRVRERRLKRKKGRGRGPGSKKGPRVDEKRAWINRVRAQRRYLKFLKEKGQIDTKTFRYLYRLVKGGMFRSLSHLKLYISEHKLVRVEEGGERSKV